MGAQVLLGEALAYRLWANMLQSYQVYNSRYKRKSKVHVLMIPSTSCSRSKQCSTGVQRRHIETHDDTHVDTH